MIILFYAPVLGRVSGDKSILPLSIIWTRKERKEKTVDNPTRLPQLATGSIMHNIMPLSGLDIKVATNHATHPATRGSMNLQHYKHLYEV